MKYDLFDGKEMLWVSRIVVRLLRYLGPHLERQLLEFTDIIWVKAPQNILQTSEHSLIFRRSLRISRPGGWNEHHLYS